MQKLQYGPNYGTYTLRLLYLVATNVSDFSDFGKIANIKYLLKLVVFLNM